MLSQVAVHEIDHILVFAVFHYEDLVDDEIFLRLLLKVHLFDGNASASFDLGSGVNSTRSSPLVYLDICCFNAINSHW